MAAATATSIESSQSLIQSESHVQRTYTETSSSEHRALKKKKSTRRHKDEGVISVSKSSEKLHKRMKASSDADANPQCEKCRRPVFAMERIKAEKRTWHKECFRCVQCNRQLTVETYQSDHTTLYCKQHFKQLFEPKPVGEEDETDAAPPKKHQMIICESNPVELPPGVVRASDKPDLGLEELAQLDVKSRFEVFEKKNKTEEPPPMEPKGPREKSNALLSRLAKFKAKGMDIGVSDEYLNGVPIEPSSSEPEDEEEGDDDDVLKKSYKQTSSREQPVSFCNMSEIVGKFESGQNDVAERHRSRKQEIQNIRSRLFMGKQAKIKEMYEQSVMQSEQSITSADKIALELDSEKARAIKARFENGEVFNDENQPPKNKEIDDHTLFNEGIGKKSRSIFLELDANAKNVGPTSPQPLEPPKRKEIPFVPTDVVRAADKVEDVQIQTADISDRFKFFETYTPAPVAKHRVTPPRVVQYPEAPSPAASRSPSPPPEPETGVAAKRHTASKMINVFRQMEENLNKDPQQASRSPSPEPETGLAATRHTASRMISVFRQMEENLNKEPEQGPKPLKRFTPPPPGAYTHDSSSEYSSESEEDSETERRQRQQARQADEALQQAQQLARTKSFRGRFENWTEAEPQRSPSVVIQREREREDGEEDDGESQLDTAKSLRAKFENMNVTQSTVKTAPKVNRFV